MVTREIIIIINTNNKNNNLKKSYFKLNFDIFWRVPCVHKQGF